MGFLSAGPSCWTAFYPCGRAECNRLACFWAPDGAPRGCRLAAGGMGGEDREGATGPVASRGETPQALSLFAPRTRVFSRSEKRQCGPAGRRGAILCYPRVRRGRDERGAPRCRERPAWRSEAVASGYGGTHAEPVPYSDARWQLARKPKGPIRTKPRRSGVFFCLHLASGFGIIRCRSAGTGDSIITPLWAPVPCSLPTPYLPAFIPFQAGRVCRRGRSQGRP